MDFLIKKRMVFCLDKERTHKNRVFNSPPRKIIIGVGNTVGGVWVDRFQKLTVNYISTEENEFGKEIFFLYFV